MVTETLALDAFSILFSNTALIIGGSALGVIGLILAISRGMSKNNDVWAVTVASFSWAIALSLSSSVFAGIIFLLGAVALTISFNPLYKQLRESNSLTLAILAIAVNLSLTVGFSTYSISAQFSWENNLAYVNTQILGQLGAASNNASALIDSNGLCVNGGNCTSEAQSGSFISSYFDVFATILAIPTYIGKALHLAALVLFAPVAITQNITSSGQINPTIAILIGLYIIVWQIMILYKAISLVLKRQGNL